jgi:DNA-binding IclR family transcriptional regulator
LRAEVNGNDVSARGSGDSSLGTLRRGLRVLDCFDVNNPGLSVSAICSCTGLPRPTAYRIVSVLESEGYLSYDAATGKYHLGSKMLRAAYVLQSPSELARIAHPYLEEVARLTEESVSLAVWTEQGPLLVDTVVTSHPFKFASPVGTVFSDCANVNSKILLAFGPKSRRAAALERLLVPRTRHTIVDPDRIAAEFAKVRSEGVAYDLEEHMMAICAVGAPVYGSTGEVLAGLAVFAPVERFREVQEARLTEAVRKVASSLSVALGYQGQRYST